MTYKILVLLSAFCLVSVACNKKISNAANQPVTPAPVVKKMDAETSGKIIKFERLENPSDIEQNLVVMLKRTPCFGKCPAYEVKIFENGTAQYIGYAFVDKIGKFDAKVSNDFIGKVQQEAQKRSFSSLSSKYPLDGSDIKDIPSTISFVRVGKKGNRVINNYDAPKDLIEFENWLENEIQNIEWKKTEN